MQENRDQWAIDDADDHDDEDASWDAEGASWDVEGEDFDYDEYLETEDFGDGDDFDDHGDTFYSSMTRRDVPLIWRATASVLIFAFLAYLWLSLT